MPAPLSSRRPALLDALKAQRAGLRQPTEKPAPPAPAPRAAPRLPGPVYRRSRTGTLRPSAPPLRALNPEGQVMVSHNPISATCLQESKSPGQSARASSARAAPSAEGRTGRPAPLRPAPKELSGRGEGMGTQGATVPPGDARVRRGIGSLFTKHLLCAWCCWVRAAK